MNKLVNLTIDGKKIQAREGDNLLQVALNNGIQIPYLCYHRKLSPTGACRMCVIKVKGQNGLIMSCTVTVQEGMEVTALASSDDYTVVGTPHEGIYIADGDNISHVNPTPQTFTRPIVASIH